MREYGSARIAAERQRATAYTQWTGRGLSSDRSRSSSVSLSGRRTGSRPPVSARRRRAPGALRPGGWVPHGSRDRADNAVRYGIKFGVQGHRYRVRGSTPLDCAACADARFVCPGNCAVARFVCPGYGDLTCLVWTEKAKLARRRTRNPPAQFAPARWLPARKLSRGLPAVCGPEVRAFPARASRRMTAAGVGLRSRQGPHRRLRLRMRMDQVRRLEIWTAPGRQPQQQAVRGLLEWHQRPPRASPKSWPRSVWRPTRCSARAFCRHWPRLAISALSSGRT